jgi:hypothetical protein
MPIAFDWRLIIGTNELPKFRQDVGISAAALRRVSAYEKCCRRRNAGSAYL